MCNGLVLLLKKIRLTSFLLLVLELLLSAGCSNPAEVESVSSSSSDSSSAIDLTLAAHSNVGKSLPSVSQSTVLISEKFVGSDRCSSCHQSEYAQWQQSHHHHAMAKPNSDSVLGDFNAVQLDYRGGKVRFETQLAKPLESAPHSQEVIVPEYFITIVPDLQAPAKEVPDRPERYRVKFTFGFYPLQQYLLETEAGALQVFEMAWDTRPKAEGGQRWFNLLANESSQEDNAFFWKHYFQNWNSQCASCHTTNLNKGFNSDAGEGEPQFKTTWSESGVGCESCHGPGNDHIFWAQSSRHNDLSIANKGLTRQTHAAAQWRFKDDDAIASKEGQAPNETEQQCFSCHSLRHPISRQAYDQVDSHWMNYFEPTAVQQPLYFADGQIREEVFVYGSFTQSKMHNAGVSCNDCHNVHSGKVEGFDAVNLSAPENDGVCLQCHRSDVFADVSHHHHKVESEAARCVTCHMPERTYMQVDPRRDHSFKVPMPALSRLLDVPNVCEQCHDKADEGWAERILDSWQVTKEPPSSRAKKESLGDFSIWLSSVANEATGLRDDTDNDIELHRQRLLKSNKTPEMQRAMLLLGMPVVDRASFLAVTERLSDKSPQVRLAAIEVMTTVDLNSRADYLSPLLDDRIKAVRLAATLALAELVNQPQYPKQALLKQRVAQFIATYREHQDLLASAIKLAEIYRRTGKIYEAENAYLSALKLVPNYIPALVNLADIYRMLSADGKAEPLLIKAVSLAKNPIPSTSNTIAVSGPNDNASNDSSVEENATFSRQAAAAEYALGLLYVRSKDYLKAKSSLADAVADDDQNPSYFYAYLLALDALDERAQAKSLLLQSPLTPADPYLAKLLVAWNGE